MRNPRFFQTFAAWLLGGFIALGATPVHALPESGWWFNPVEGGRGFFLEVEGPRMFMAGYFYESDGRATWLVSNDLMPGNDSYQGRLLRFTNGQTLVGGYQHPLPASDAGPISLGFTDDRHGTLTWAGGTVPIQRYDFQRGDDAAFQPTTGWWWNPDQSGRGFSIELQGDHMFIGAYMYDAAGNPVWYVADAFMQSPTIFRGPLLQFANGQTLTGSYRAPTAPAAMGTITVQFSTPDEASVTLSDQPSVAVSSAPKTVTTFFVQPLVAALVHLDLPSSFTGTFTHTEFFHAVNVTYEITGTVTLIEKELTALDGSRDYEISVGHIKSKVSGVVPADNCIGILTGHGERDLFPAEGQLSMKRSGKFGGKIFFKAEFTNSLCGETYQSSTFVFIPLVGTLRWDSPSQMEGSLVEEGEPTITSHWKLTPTR